MRASRLCSLSSCAAPEARLVDHRPAIQLVGDEVHTAAVLAISGEQHIAVGVQTLVLGQQRRMDVQQAPAVARHETRRQDAHEACEHHQLGARLHRSSGEGALECSAIGMLLGGNHCASSPRPRRPPRSPRRWRDRRSRARSSHAAAARGRHVRSRPCCCRVPRSGSRGAACRCTHRSSMTTPRCPRRTSPMIQARSPLCVSMLVAPHRPALPRRSPPCRCRS